MMTNPVVMGTVWTRHSWMRYHCKLWERLGKEGSKADGYNGV